MSDQTETLNDAGESSQPEPVQSEELISTIDQPIPVEKSDEESSEETQNTEPETDAEESDDDQDPKEAEKEPPFHEHPRFKELIDEKNALKEQLAQLAAKQSQQATPTPDKSSADYEDIGAMTAEQVQDRLDEDPVGFLANFAKQVRTEVQSEILGQIEQRDQERFQQTQEEAIAREYQAYAKDHPDFETMWDSGDIEKYMNEHPGHNAISAHMILTQEAREAELLRKAEAKIQKNLKVKKSAQVLPSGPSSSGRVSGKTPPELSDTKKYGGLAAVLAQRSVQRLADR